MRKKTHQEFVAEISIKHPNIEILSTYVDSRTKISCKCKVCEHKWDVLPTSLSRGYGCRICGYKKTREALLSNTDEFNEKLSLVNSNIIAMSEYVSAQQKMLFKCKVCENEFEMRPYSVLNGNNCPECSMRSRRESQLLSNDKFIQRLLKYNPNVEPLEEYKGGHTKIRCRCKIHNREWSTTPGELYHGSGCPECYTERIRKALSWSKDEFILRLEKVNPDIEVLGEYINSQTGIECRCKKCGYIWYPKPNNLLYGKVTGCPKCQSYSKGEDRVQEYLERNHIRYRIHKTYHDLLGIGGKRLSFDFYLPDYNLLIEFQGQQHESPATFGNITIEEANKKFEIQQEHDERKRNYAQEHKIELLEIWYYDYNNINQILDKKLNINNAKRTA